MRKKIVIAAIILCVAGLVLLIASLNLSRLSAYVIGRITDSSVTIGDAGLARNGAYLDIHYKDIRLKGKIEGIVRNFHVVINAAKGIYFKEISVSDFEITVKPVAKSGRFFEFPVELIDVKNGIITVSGEKITVNTIKAVNLNIDDTLSLDAHIQSDDFIGTIDVRGEGTYNKRKTDVKGDVSLAGLNLAKIDRILRGTIKSTGTFSLKEDKLTFTGKAEATRFELMDTWLKRSVALDRVDSNVSMTAEGKIVDIKIENVFYKETPFVLDIKLQDYQYVSLDLTSNFIDVQDITSYATSEYSLQHVWTALKGGNVKAKKLRHEKSGLITVDLEMKDIAAVYEDMSFSDIKGEVHIDMSKVDISSLSGTYKTSRFYDVNGTIPYEEKKPARAKGKYEVNLKDMPPFIDLKGIIFKDGTTDGTAEVEVKHGQTMKIKGSGKINDAHAEWKDTFFEARGIYRFSHDDIVFDPLVIAKKRGTDITCRGRWNGDNLDFSLKGMLEPQHLNSLLKPAFNMAGRVELDGELNTRDGILKAGGDVNMDDMVLEIPGYMKKGRGAKSKARVKLSKKGSDVTIDDLYYELESITAWARGTVSGGKKINADIDLNIHDMARVAKIFFLPEETTNGDVSLGLNVKDLELPLKRLPYIVGDVKVKNGFIRLPGWAKPFQNMSLVADFKGASFNVRMSSLSCGQSTLKQGVLRVNGLETPKFSLSIDMERFNLADFSGDSKEPFRIPLVPQQSIFARASGEMSLKAKEAVLGKMSGPNLKIESVMNNRKITVSELKMGLFNGEADLQGVIDLSGKAPNVSADGKLGKINTELALRALNGTNKDITGKTFINGNLKSEGFTVTDLISNMEGTATFYNNEGTIRKWNLISKIFGFLNLYDLFRGKVDFTQDGLKYNKFGATFTGKKGIFNTDNFLLDSSSMVFTGKGQLDLNKNEIDGTINVSPLIVIDRTIDQIPVLRTILKEPGQGFLYFSYSVKGPLDDPQITPSVISTIGGKAIETLKNILTLPKGVFE